MKTQLENVISAVIVSLFQNLETISSDFILDTLIYIWVLSLKYVPTVSSSLQETYQGNGNCLCHIHKISYHSHKKI